MQVETLESRRFLSASAGHAIAVHDDQRQLQFDLRATTAAVVNAKQTLTADRQVYRQLFADDHVALRLQLQADEDLLHTHAPAIDHKAARAQLVADTIAGQIQFNRVHAAATITYAQDHQQIIEAEDHQHAVLTIDRQRLHHDQLVNQ